MSVQSIIDAITGGDPEVIAAAVGQQQRYDNYEVAEILAGAAPGTATKELKEQMAKAKEEHDKMLKEREQMMQAMDRHAQNQTLPQWQGQYVQAQHTPAQAQTQRGQHEGAHAQQARKEA